MYSILTDEEVLHLFELFKDRQNDFILHVVKALPDIIYVMNLDTRAIIYASRLLAMEIGYSASEIASMSSPMMDIMHPDDRDRFVEHLDQLKHSKPFEVLAIEYRMIRHNGKIAWFTDRNTVFTRHASGMPATKIGITHEITSRKLKEEKLLKQESIMQQTEVLAGTGSWEYDADRSAFTWSKGMYRLFHLPETSDIHPSIYRQYSTEADSAVAEKIVGDIESQKPFEEVLHIRVQGDVRAIKIKAAPVDNAFGHRKIVGVDLDITKDELQQRQLQSLNKDLHIRSRHMKSLHLDVQTLTRLTSSYYKDNFKNMYTMLEFLITQDAEKLGNSGRANIRRMQSVVHRLNLMTDDILSYLDISQDALSVENHSLKKCVEEVLSQMQDRLLDANAKVDVEVSGVIRTDNNLFSLLMYHLLSNALRISMGDKPVSISIRSDYVQVEDANFLTVSVQDNGPGFEPDQLERIFELFYKDDNHLPAKGLRVGLAIARKIMDIHLGMIHAVSAPGQGTTFTCYFPI